MTGNVRLLDGQCARRVRDDDFRSTMYKDGTLRKERSLLSASAFVGHVDNTLGKSLPRCHGALRPGRSYHSIAINA